MGGSGGSGGGKSGGDLFRKLNPVEWIAPDLAKYDVLARSSEQAIRNTENVINGKESFGAHRNWLGPSVIGNTDENEQSWRDYENKEGIYAPKESQYAKDQKAKTAKTTSSKPRAKSKSSLTGEEEDTGNTLLT